MMKRVLLLALAFGLVAASSVDAAGVVLKTNPTLAKVTPTLVQQIQKAKPTKADLNLAGKFKISPSRLLLFKQTKKKVSEKNFKLHYPGTSAKPLYQFKNRQYALMPESVLARVAPLQGATKIVRLEPTLAKFAPYINRVVLGPIVLPPGLIPDVDRRSAMSPVKDQGNRGTCVAFASCAALEAFGSVPDDLSEQDAYHAFMMAEARRCHGTDGIRTTNAATYLHNTRICTENYWPYQPVKSTVNCPGATHRPAAAASHALYGIQSSALIESTAETGPSIRNTAYLESLLSAGRNIVLGTHVAWDGADAGGILDVVLTAGGEPAPSRGGHAMLIVGYNHAQEYFIVKNSWGSDWGHNGYAYLSYDYIRTYAKYGYYVTGVY